MATRREVEEALGKAVVALEGAPHKHRMEFDPYWEWYDGQRAEALKLAAEALRAEPASK